MLGWLEWWFQGGWAGESEWEGGLRGLSGGGGQERGGRRGLLWCCTQHSTRHLKVVGLCC